jgi:hypothetical protein
MKIIESLDEIRNLEIGEKFYVVCQGEFSCFLFAGLNPMTNEPMGINNANYSKVECFSAGMFLNRDYKCCMIGEYVSNEIGQIMLDQLTRRIESIKSIYLKQ